MWTVVTGLTLGAVVGGAGGRCAGSDHRRAQAPRVEDAATPVATVPAAEVDAFLLPYRAALAASRRPVLRISLEPLSRDELTASKVGGRAWWPLASAEPKSADGHALVLLAQINFAETPPMPGYPRRGLLQFFIAPNDTYGVNFSGGVEVLSEQRDFRVAYWPELTAAARALEVPPAAATPHQPSHPKRMRFVAGDEELTFDDYRFDRLFDGGLDPAAEAFAGVHGGSGDALVEAVYERHRGGGHKLGGYPAFTQTDPRTDGDWELLLQIDSDDDGEVMWGDVGVGNFFIAPADLARADFRRVLYTWDCS